MLFTYLKTTDMTNKLIPFGRLQRFSIAGIPITRDSPYYKSLNGVKYNTRTNIYDSFRID